MIRFGPAGWDYPDWRGKVYPKPAPRGFDPLAYLATFFDVVEVNSTFYRPQPAKVARLLVVLFAALSAGMNYLAADVSSFRSVAVYVMPPAVFAVCTDQTVAVIRRHGLGITEDSAWIVLGRLVLAAARLAGIMLLYGLRFILAPSETARGLRRMVLNAAPLPEAGQGHPAPEAVPEGAPALPEEEHDA